jgi:HAD superfamily hydrolase (TIGR01509 family)
VFDLDGTLIESEQIWRDVRREFVVANGGQWKSDAAAAMIGMRTDEWARYIHDELGVALAPSAIEKRVVEEVVRRLLNPPVIPGADAALHRMAKEFRLGLASSAALAIAQTVLAATGWNELFAVVVSADEVARGKPAPDVYLRALELLDAVPSEAVAVEDSGNGIRSAHAARIAVVAIPNREFPPGADALSLASRVIANLEGLDAALIRQILRA